MVGRRSLTLLPSIAVTSKKKVDDWLGQAVNLLPER